MIKSYFALNILDRKKIKIHKYKRIFYQNILKLKISFVLYRENFEIFLFFIGWRSFLIIVCCPHCQQLNWVWCLRIFIRVKVCLGGYMFIWAFLYFSCNWCLKLNFVSRKILPWYLNWVWNMGWDLQKSVFFKRTFQILRQNIYKFVSRFDKIRLKLTDFCKTQPKWFARTISKLSNKHTPK